MAVGDAHVSCFSDTSTNTTFFPKPLTTFLRCFSSDERRKYAGKKVRLNQVSNSQPPGHESETLTTEPPRQGMHPPNHNFYIYVLISKQFGTIDLLNPFPNNKFLDWSNLKELAHDRIYVTLKLNFLGGRVGTHCRKRRKCWLPAFSTFPTMFSKGLFSRAVKS